MEQHHSEYPIKQCGQGARQALPYKQDCVYVPARSNIFRRFWSWLIEAKPVQADALHCEQTPLPPDIQITPQRRAQIHDALAQWRAATAYFESVTDPALVDYAVFDMEAAQKRYMYLLRSTRS